MQPIKEEPRDVWRRVFIHRIIELAGGEADVLQIADWAIQAQNTHGARDPVYVANDEWRSGVPPIPD